MNRDRILRGALRTIAIVIAVLGAVDPAITTRHAARPIVSVVGADSAAVARVAQRMDARADAIRAPFAVADASVIVGEALPSTEEVNALARPVFALREDPSAARVSIANVRVPSWVPRAARVPIEVDVEVNHAHGRRIDVSATSGGVIVAQASSPIAADSARISVSLGYVPTAAGASLLRVSANIAGVRDSAVADAVVDVRDVRWNVLVYDARPSWMSTFVRRALEQDPRFAVTSRVVTSRGVSTDVGRPPARLDDASALEAFDAVVVGAPDALSPQDVAGLETFLRRRAGGVMLLLDRRASGPYERLASVTSWQSDSGKAMTVVARSDSIRAAEVTWPAKLPPGAEAMAFARLGDTARAAVWGTNVGAGRVVTSGALDAWRFRDRGSSESGPSSFDRFWRELVANVASGSPSPLDVRVAHPVMRPGERTSVAVTLREAALSSAPSIHASAAAVISNGRQSTAIRLLPTTRSGELIAELTAPSTRGVYRVAVSSGNARAEVPFVVVPDAAPPHASRSDLVAALASERGGGVIDASTSDVARAVTAAIHAPARAVAWHPMRSAWWIVLFAGALSGEWWLRRRRGVR